MAGSPRGRLVALVALAMLTLLGILTPARPAGAATSQYQFMVSQRASGVPIGCADLRYAASQRLIAPVEVHWLEDAGVSCGNRNYTLMLALGAHGTLTCADVEWNAARGYLNWSQAVEVMTFTPGCVLSRYGFLVAVAASNALTCDDVNFYEGQALVSPQQSDWLRPLVAQQQSAPCERPVPAPPADGPPTVAFAVTPGAFCAAADHGAFGRTKTGLLMRCVDTRADPYYRWRQA